MIKARKDLRLSVRTPEYGYKEANQLRYTKSGDRTEMILLPPPAAAGDEAA
jgi:hypothetical protein